MPVYDAGGARVFTETELEYWTAVIRKAGITGELQ
jgi:hypothetical protein